MGTTISASATAALLLLLAFGFMTGNPANAHTFSTNESAQFLSMSEQIKAETQLVVKNLADSNVTLAQIHAEKAANLLDTHALAEIRERNSRIADSLQSNLDQLRANVSSLQMRQDSQMSAGDNIQGINQTVMTINDILAEAVAVRVETEQLNNATTWATVLANLTNVVLSNYGNATGAGYDLTNMSNLADMAGHQMNDSSMSMDHESTADQHNDTMNMMSSNRTVIVNASSYQTANYLSGDTVLRLFNETLKPLTLNNMTAADSNVTSNIDRLEMNLLQLKDDISGVAPPQHVMRSVHMGIHPLLIQLYGLTIEDMEEDSHSGMSH